MTFVSVPGIAADLLHEIDFAGPGGRRSERLVAGRRVAWRTFPEFTTATWTLEGTAIQVGGQPDDVEAAIPRLPF